MHWPRTKIRPFIFPLVVPLASYEKWTGSNRVWYMECGMEERKTATSATFLGHVQRLLITRDI